ncbi:MULTISPECIES: amidohydrolase family protein [Roseomonadaceae]|uniref:Amidohydrolase family protein n=1 Tax=Falsiroseomonas oleicola TaxID=2801474 RepID=A0ABS6HBQ1_9PROT|nr:amidohydrolase family protein [Roseomonas oleicola]MBU8546144.1 amidohydrolase family protein [Roseomonas oleicola]
MFCCPVCTPGLGRFVCSPDMGSGGGGGAAAAIRDAVSTGRPGERWIDIHCHLFNIRDLPAREFIMQTRLNMPSIVDVPAFLALAALVGGLNGMGITAKDELRALGKGTDPRLLTIGGAGSTEEALRAIRDGVATEPHGFQAPWDQEPRLPPLPEGAADVLKRAADETLPGRAPGSEVSNAEIAALARRIDEDTGPSREGFTGWAHTMAKPRDQLTGELLKQFPEGADVLLTPALVDYSRWLGIRGSRLFPDPAGNVEEQIGVMAAISDRRARNSSAKRRSGLFSFAPFCPWRQAEAMASRSRGRIVDTPLERVERWVRQGHVIGVKLYPPMGFLPIGNEGRSADLPRFPDRLRELAGTRDPGAILDAALAQLYAFCEANGVAVMAHCGDSNSPFETGGSLAGPHAWGRVLEQWPQLRLNLAHFGGVFSFGSRDLRARETSQDWAERIAVLMERRPHLYADIGFGGQFLDEGDVSGEAAASITFLEDLIHRHPLLRRRLMYGSDWVMVGMVRGGGRYASLIARSMARLFPFDAMEDFRWRNAARFLGLAEGEQARERMVRWLEPRSPGLLARFDPTAPMS